MPAEASLRSTLPTARVQALALALCLRAGWIGARILAVETLEEHSGVHRFSGTDDLLPLARCFTTQVLPTGRWFLFIVRDKQSSC